MKKISILFLSLLSVITYSQKIKEILLYKNSGKFIVSCEIKNYTVQIDSSGNLIALWDSSMNATSNISSNFTSYSFNSDQDFHYNENGNSNLTSGSNVKFYDNSYDYENGKLKEIDGVKFNYFDGFYTYQKGKLKSIDTIKFSYYDNFYRFQEGKVKSIDGIEFTYYDDFYDYKKRKIKIGKKQ